MARPRPARRARVGAALGAILLALTAGCASGGPPGTTTLVLADSFPTTHPVSRDGARFFMERVGELTGGRVRFEYFPSEQLGAAEDFVSLARSGVVDVAMVSPGYVASQLPLSGVADLPAMSPTSCRGSLAAESLMTGGGVLQEADFAPDGLHPLLVGVIPGYEVMTGGSRVVTEPSDVAGMQLRSSGGAIDRAVAQLGAAPVAMPVTEMYEAISRGTVDGTVLGPMSALPYRLDEAATHSTEGAQLGSFTITYSIGTQAWDALPADLQAALTQAGRDTTRHLCRAIDEENAASRAELAAGGLAFHTLTPDEQRRWHDAVAPVRDRWVADMERLGLPGRAVLDAMLAALRDQQADAR
ncbi:TRAP transporter substrate-binding protein DctP [Pseudonocardia sp. MH-G8]|uniref:TRAP transporter substrate-binding protein n=1 Tax=Pseudonocardia sp. MH-G8 TaxID=1854588 RepID=UPI000BA09BD0|nr:TRAP transporter substrate-binding protein DctP [Pseudonocardia sp. MH-G8]OZM75978.1 hypothetical protein CFP66_43760 [Pseudonocardia sp. MH-G8]